MSARAHLGQRGRKARAVKAAAKGKPAAVRAAKTRLKHYGARGGLRKA